jgi:xanthosine utilization system XapX-like protein
LQILLWLAFGALFLALLPEVLQLLGVTSAGLWRSACAAALLYSAVFVAFWSLSSLRVRRLAPEIFDNTASARMPAGHAITAGLLLGVVASLIEQRAPGIYLVALIWYLIHAAQQFTPAGSRQCGGRLRVIACIEDPPVIERIRAHLGGSTTAVDPTHPSRAPPGRPRLI